MNSQLARLADGPDGCDVFIAWTTVANRADAERLADAAVSANVAACVQIEGPIVSHYRWEGRIERSEEFRLTFKFVAPQLAGLENLIQKEHPYTTPEWIVVRADRVAEKYLSWAEASSSTPPL